MVVMCLDRAGDMLTFPTVIRTPVITYDEKWQNLTRQKVKVTVHEEEKDTEYVFLQVVSLIFIPVKISKVQGRGIAGKDSLIRAAGNR